MGVPIAIHLDDDVRAELAGQALARGIGLATLLQDLTTETARAARRARIHTDSAAIGDQVRQSEECRAFYKHWGTGDQGTPHADGS